MCIIWYVKRNAIASLALSLSLFFLHNIRHPKTPLLNFGHKTTVKRRYINGGALKRVFFSPATNSHPMDLTSPSHHSLDAHSPAHTHHTMTACVCWVNAFHWGFIYFHCVFAQGLASRIAYSASPQKVLYIYSIPISRRVVSAHQVLHRSGKKPIYKNV